MEKTLKLINGKTYRATGENAKYYLCGKTQFRKANPAILSVEEVKPKEKPAREEKKDATAAAPKKEKAAKAEKTERKGAE